MKFHDFNFEQEILDSIDSMGFEKASPIQEKAIPAILEQKDLIACAQTGTGKTAAFLLPVLNQLVKNKDKEGIKAIILAPTRELAMQIDQQLEGFSYFTDLSSIAIYGGGSGMDWEMQRKALRSGADFIVATPGKILGHLHMGYVDVSHLEYLILDEADRMLDMGFFEDICSVISYLPKERQTLMFSATMPPKIRKLAEEILTEPETVNIAVSKPAEGVLQAAYLAFDDQKVDLISSLLEGKDLQSVIIFASTKSKVDEIVRNLVKEGFDAKSIHSDLEQSERESRLLDFRNKQFPILVATDILARGIDIESIDLIINYDVPQDAEDYVHRVGRTARAQNTGLAITFVNDQDQYKFLRIERLIEKEVMKLPLPQGFDEGPKYEPIKRRPASNGNRKGGRNDGRGGYQSRGRNNNGQRSGNGKGRNGQSNDRRRNDNNRRGNQGRDNRMSAARRPNNQDRPMTPPKPIKLPSPRKDTAASGNRADNQNPTSSSDQPGIQSYSSIESR